MTNSEIFRVLDIARKYADGGDRNFLCEHDTLYVLLPADRLTDKDHTALMKLGVENLDVWGDGTKRIFEFFLSVEVA